MPRAKSKTKAKPGRPPVKSKGTAAKPKAGARRGSKTYVEKSGRGRR